MATPLPSESMTKPPPCLRGTSACEINARFRAVFCPCEINSDSWGQRGAVGTNRALSLRAFFSQTPDSRKEAPTAFVKNRTHEAELGVGVCHSIYCTRVFKESKGHLKGNIMIADRRKESCCVLELGSTLMGRMKGWNATWYGQGSPAP